MAQRHGPAGTTIAGTEIPPGANVAAIIASANRDRAAWGEDADAYDLFRPAVQTRMHRFDLASERIREAIEHLA